MACIAHVVSTYPPYRGGMGNVAHALVERTRTRGHDVRIVTPQTARVLLRFGNAAWCPSLDQQLGDVDIVHFHWPFIGGLAPVLWWKRHNPRRTLVVQYHMDLIGSGWRGMVFRWYERIALPRMIAHADRVVVSSRDYAEHGALAPFLPLLGERFAEIPLGVDAERFRPTPSHSPSRREGEKGARLLFVGGLDAAHAFKGLSVLLDAIARVPEVQLRIVGDGALRPAYEQQARALGIANRVAFLGSVSDEDLPKVYAQSDVFVLPSTARSEAFGLVLLEAMASGKPTITSNLPGVRTVVRDGVTGLIVEPNNASALARTITLLRDDAEQRHAFGAAGRRDVEAHYTWEHVVDQWVGVYEQL